MAFEVPSAFLKAFCFGFLSIMYFVARMMFWKLGKFTSSNSFLRKKFILILSFFLSFFLWIFVPCLHSDTGISLPTFIIAECVLIYLDPESTRGIVGWASKTFSTAAFFLYEQVLNFLKAN